jgi:hypothetical protein
MVQSLMFILARNPSPRLLMDLLLLISTPPHQEKKKVKQLVKFNQAPQDHIKQAYAIPKIIHCPISDGKVEISPASTQSTTFGLVVVSSCDSRDQSRMT